jgi:hypothetical protein
MKHENRPQDYLGRAVSTHVGHPQNLSLNRIAWSATMHCLLGCAIGEVAGMVIGTALGLSNTETLLLALVLAFISGFALTSVAFLRRGLGLRASFRIAIASDTASITVMEVVDNAIMVLIPGAMDARLDSALFWISLAISLALAAAFAYPVNRWLISRGKGHALAHGYHH